ncbi:hypothetical protein HCZ30_11455 [Marivivens donghaensis]|uniref:Uncharacterized protein n=1 Tax=Marivivens donghaensis TaxID=1699413 RepID=A0ABX0W295_9RHOB|nr:hypothetical protein [Marivivens donghaensis]NIY73047.1 hypothetical protein [Marivivens donghaensis]
MVSNQTCGGAAESRASLATAVVGPGPLLPFDLLPTAAAQLHWTGYSTITQHFQKMKVATAVRALFLCRYADGSAKLAAISDTKKSSSKQ